jgi:hypothetical protein
MKLIIYICICVFDDLFLQRESCFLHVLSGLEYRDILREKGDAWMVCV